MTVFAAGDLANAGIYYQPSAVPLTVGSSSPFFASGDIMFNGPLTGQRILSSIALTEADDVSAISIALRALLAVSAVEADDSVAIAMGVRAGVAATLVEAPDVGAISISLGDARALSVALIEANDVAGLTLLNAVGSLLTDPNFLVRPGRVVRVVRLR